MPPPPRRRTPEDARFVEGLQARLREKGLSEAASFRPNLEREGKVRFLQGLTVLSVPATYGEAFGLYVIEALAAGVPVVVPRHAAFPELVEATGGGLLCPPEDPAALAAAIGELLADPPRARELGERGRQAVLDRFSVERMAREILAAAWEG
jgi:glycosyltransferase involved in cell wall biosynthesis